LVFVCKATAQKTQKNSYPFLIIFFLHNAHQDAHKNEEERERERERREKDHTPHKQQHLFVCLCLFFFSSFLPIPIFSFSLFCFANKTHVGKKKSTQHCTKPKDKNKEKIFCTLPKNRKAKRHEGSFLEKEK